MRTIKFRGFSELKNKWFYGSLVLANSESSSEIKHYSIVSDQGYRYEVIPETVGQFTGLTDKNGKEIYEGDILKNAFRNRFQTLVCYWSELDTGLSYLDILDHIDRFPTLCEVIGNIYDNPELLK